MKIFAAIIALPFLFTGRSATAMQIEAELAADK